MNRAWKARKGVQPFRNQRDWTRGLARARRRPGQHVRIDQVYGVIYDEAASWSREGR